MSQRDIQGAAGQPLPSFEDYQEAIREALMDQERNVQRECLSCGRKLQPTMLQLGEPHDGGYPVQGQPSRVWLHLRCSCCYATALWKMGDLQLPGERPRRRL